MKGPLSGVTVLVTRPPHQAEGLCRLIEAEGGEARRLPLMAIEPVGDPVELEARIQALKSADGWLLTSRNAVDRLVALAPGPWPPCFAIGPATAQALVDTGRAAEVIRAAGSSSEALLGHPQLQSISGLRYAVFSGEGGLDQLVDGLRERGAEVDKVAVYRRVAETHPAARIEAEIALADAILVGSGEALSQLWQQTPDSLKPMLLRRRLVVPSLRVVEEAQAMGFEAALVPSTVSDEAWLRCLIEWREATADSNMNDQPPDRASTPAGETAEPEPAPSPAPAPGPAPEPAHGPESAPPATGTGSALLAWVLVAILLTALLAGAAWFWQRDSEGSQRQTDQDQLIQDLSARVESLQLQSGQLASRQGDLSRSLQRNGVDLAALQARAQESADVMGRISEDLQGGRLRFQLASVEHLLMLANDRLLLEADVDAAIAALELAEQRLAALEEPRLFSVRQALADERAGLLALPPRGHAGVVMQVSSLIDRVGDLPMVLELPAAARPDAAPRASQQALSDAPPGRLERLKMSLQGALDALFTVRRTDRPEDLRLLPAQQAMAIRQSLTLKLESARVALLREDLDLFRSAVASAAALLDEYFDRSQPAVQGALTDLASWQALEPTAPTPPIDRSLVLLRAQIEAPAQ